MPFETCKNPRAKRHGVSEELARQLDVLIIDAASTRRQLKDQARLEGTDVDTLCKRLQQQDGDRTRALMDAISTREREMNAQLVNPVAAPVIAGNVSPWVN